MKKITVRSLSVMIGSICGDFASMRLSRTVPGLVVGLAITLLSTDAGATTKTWAALVNCIWDTTTANWVGPTTFANNDDAVFDGGTSSLNATGAVSLTIGNITLQNGYGGTVALQAANTVTGSTTLASGTMSILADNNLGSSNAPVTFNGGTLRTVNSAGALANTHAMTVGAGGGTLNIAGLATTGQKSMVVFNTAGTLLGSGPLTLTGNGALDGAGGSGALAVNASNAFSGTLTLQNGGLFEYGNAKSVDASATFTLGNSGGMAANTSITVANGVTVNGANSVLSFNNGNAGVYSGAITLNTNVTVGLRDWWSGTVRNGMISGPISGPGGIAVNSGTNTGGIVAIGNINNTYSGGTTISNALVLAGITNWNGTALNGAGNTYSNCQQAALGTGTVTLNTNGVLQMGYRASPNTGSYIITNSIVMNGGVIWANDGYQHLSGPISVLSGGYLGSTYAGVAGSWNKGLFVDGVVSGSGPLTLEQAGYGGNGAPAEANGWGNATGNAFDSSIVMFTANNSYSGTIRVMTGGTGANSYLGVNATGALVNATINLNGNNSGLDQRFGSSPLVFQSGLGGAFTLGALAGSGNVNLADFNEATAVTGNAIVLTVGGNNSNTTYSGVMAGSGRLIKDGTGTMTMSGTNTYTGTTTINAGGTFAVGGAGQLGSGAYAAAITNNGAFVYNSSAPQALGGTVSGTGTLTQSGPGKLSVNGTVLNTGGVTVNAGAGLAGTGTVACAVILATGTNDAARGAIDLRGGTVGEVLTLANLTVGGSSNYAASLCFDVASNVADRIALTNAFTVNDGGAVITIPLTPSLLPGYTNALMTFASGTGSGFVTGSGAQVGGLSLANPQPTFGLTCSLIVTSTNVLLVTSGSLPPATAYWSGSQGTSWTNVSGGVANFTTDQAGTTPVGAYPSLNTDVIFGRDGAVNLSGITLGQDFFIKSLSFLNNVGAVTISPDSHTVTLESGNGLAVQGGAGAVDVGANVAMNAAQSWTNASSNDLTVSGTISGATNASLSIANTGSGKTVLSGANTYSGNTTVSSGTIKLANENALLNSTLYLGGSGLEFDSSVSSHAFTLGGLDASASMALQDNAANAVTLNVGSNGSSTTCSGVLSAGGALTKSGSGTLTLTATNTYTGATTISAGTLQINGAGQLYSGSYSGALTNNGTLGLGSTADHALSGVISGSGALVKSGSGTLTLSGANSYTGNTTMNGGALVLSGSGAINASGNTTPKLLIGNESGANAAVYQSGVGTVVNCSAATGGSFQIGSVPGGSGYYNFSAGSIVIGNGAEIDPAGSTGGAGTFGQFDMSGGTLTLGTSGTGPTYFLPCRSGTAGESSVVNISGGSVNFWPSMADANFAGYEANWGAGGQTNATTISGSAVFSSPSVSVKLNWANNGANVASLNLNGGTFQILGFRANRNANAVVNFNGGTMKAGSSGNAGFMTGLGAAYVRGGGAVIDDNSRAITIGQALLTPAGNGVSSISLLTAGAGYVVPPQVFISGGGGSGATAYATISGGVVTGIIVTSPGNNYSSPPTVTLAGGGYTSAATIDTVMTTANISGGLVKLGTGTLTLSGSNTYSGVTVVSNGTLAVNGSVANAVNVVSNTTLAGTGIVYGAVAVAAGGVVSPGLVSSNYAALTIGPGSILGGTLVINISSNGASDRLVSTGALGLGGMALSVVETNLLTVDNTNDYVIATSATSVVNLFGASNLPKGWIVTSRGGTEVHLKQGFAGTIFIIR